MLDIAQESEPTTLGSPRRPNADLPPRQGPPDHPPGSPGKNKGGYIRIIVIYNDIYIYHTIMIIVIMIIMLIVILYNDIYVYIYVYPDIWMPIILVG